MDIFDVLTAISKRKKAFIHSGITEHEALMKAELDVSKNITFHFLTSGS